MTSRRAHPNSPAAALRNSMRAHCSAVLQSAALLCLLLGGAPGLQAASVSAPVPSAGSEAAVLYHNYCSVCHGDKGDGKSRRSQFR